MELKEMVVCSSRNNDNLIEAASTLKETLTLELLNMLIS
jgi:hypothetical protein